MSEEPVRIACIGECMGELSSSGTSTSANNFQLNFAGDTFNTACYLSRGLSRKSGLVSYVTVIGEDRLSQDMAASFVANGLDTTLVYTTPDHTVGLYMINNDDHGERTFSYWRGNSAARTLMENNRETLLAEKLKSFDLIYLSGITLAILPKESRERFISLLSKLEVPLAFDPNYREKLWSSKTQCQDACNKIAPHCQFLLATLDDEQSLWNVKTASDAATLWRDRGAGEVIIKNGGAATMVYSKSLDDYPLKKIIERPIDTTGAGDAFNASYLVHRIAQESIQVSCDAAHSLCARVIMQKGAILSDASLEI